MLWIRTKQELHDDQGKTEAERELRRAAKRLRQEEARTSEILDVADTLKRIVAVHLHRTRENE